MVEIMVFLQVSGDYFNEPWPVSNAHERAGRPK
jgi:hypothetical protein